jgi:AraC-like DNA-binding protein
MFPWASSRSLRFTAEGDFPLAFLPACPLLLHFLQFTTDHRLTPSHHNYFEISLVCEGSGRFAVENRSYCIFPGDVLVVGSREFHLMQVDNGTLKAAAVHFQPGFVHAIGGPDLDFEYLKPFYYRSAKFSHRVPATELPENLVLDRISRIHREIQTPDKDYPLAVKTYLLDMLLEISRHYRRLGGELIPQEQRIRDVERLRPVLSYTLKNCREPISLAQVARMAHMSPNYFCRFFKSVTGTTFSQYVLRLRVDLAVEFLSNSPMSITEIAFAAGFSGHSYFDRVFRKFKGVTPLEYRRQLKS